MICASWSIYQLHCNIILLQQFRFPLSITMTHLVTKFVFAAVMRMFCHCKTGRDSITLGWMEYIKRVGPPGEQWVYAAKRGIAAGMLVWECCDRVWSSSLMTVKINSYECLPEFNAGLSQSSIHYAWKWVTCNKPTVNIWKWNYTLQM